MRARHVLNFFILATLFFPAVWGAESGSALVVVLDASGSMWGKVERENKIVVARRVLGDLLDGLPDGSDVGLVAYGHRRKGDCDDIETVAPLAALDKDALKKAVDRLDPKGQTPITKAVRRAFELVRQRQGGATVILLSDGLETCGGDPCEAVREAKRQGLEFILHVVGFDVASEDVSQLECAAQAGEGLFFSAESANQLADSLQSALTVTPETPTGRLSLKATADGGLLDVSVVVSPAEGGEPLAKVRTYASRDTNPRLIPLPDGDHEVTIRAVGLKGDNSKRFRVEIAGGATVEREVDFSTGEISIGATRDGRLTDGLYRIYLEGEREVVASGRTYQSASSNPATVRITAGRYDLTLSSVEMDDHPERRFEGLEVPPGGRLEVSHDWPSGTLRVGVVQGGRPIDGLIQVSRASDGKTVAQARAYAKPDSNLKDFILQPGSYRVRVSAIRLPKRPWREFEIELKSGETVSRPTDFGP